MSRRQSKKTQANLIQKGEIASEKLMIESEVLFADLKEKAKFLEKAKVASSIGTSTASCLRHFLRASGNNVLNCFLI